MSQSILFSPLSVWFYLLNLGNTLNFNNSDIVKAVDKSESSGEVI